MPTRTTRPARGRASLEPAVGPGAPLASTDAQIEESFRMFRESAVRLVERVTDLAGPAPAPTGEGEGDVRLLRSVFGKWSADIMVALHRFPAVGFEELRRSVPGISARVLSFKLSELEEADLVRREVVDARPPRVRYSLTERGWTVTWLAQPILLYLRITEPPGTPASGVTGRGAPAPSSGLSRAQPLSAPAPPRRAGP